MRLRPLLRTLRSGDTRLRVAALRSSRQALDVAVAGAALRLGILEELREPVSTSSLAERRGWADRSLVEAALRSFAAHGLLEERGGLWRTGARGRRILDDDIVRAVYEAFSTYHTALYRELDQELTAGGHRRDIEVDGELIARLSRFMDEFVFAELDRLVVQRPPRRLLDVGCGAAAHLRHVLRAAPEATAVGVETDHAAAALARAAVADEGLGSRAKIVAAPVTSFLEERPAETFDLVLLANVVYYIPFGERVAFLRSLAGRLDVDGRLVVVTTALTDDSFSSHFDLLLRAQSGHLELPDVDVLCRQLSEAGLVPEKPRRIAPGEPLTVVVAQRR
jgi:2-polyprenyl-3-methyl-5-hydroxy-6-metoxy-1,4-benzoquinol methylase